MSSWTTAEWIALLGVAVALITAAFAIMATRRWGNRRSKLLVAHTSAALLAAGAASNHLEVTYQNAPIEKPHLVTLILKNVGPNDITRAHFDDNKPLQIALNSTFYALTGSKSSAGQMPGILVGSIGAADAIVGFPPAHLPKGSEWVVEILVSGPAEPKLLGNLINTDMVVTEATSNSTLRVLTEALAALMPWPLDILITVLLKNQRG